MLPVSPVFPSSQPIEETVGANQPEYLPLPAFRTDRMTVSRWSLSDSERAHIAAGGDLFLCQLNFRNPLQPILPIAASPDDALRIALDCEANV